MAGVEGESRDQVSPQYFVYILSSPTKTLYIGVTNDLVRRVWEHREGLVDGFTKKYRVHKLVYFEETGDVENAILREKRIKKWNRQWKIDLIKQFNPTWRDLYFDLASERSPLSRG